MLTITLKPGREASVYRRHHWIFSGAIQSIDQGVQEGDLISILSSKKEIMGFGHYSDSNISIRILQFGGKDWEAAFWKKKLSVCLEFRRHLGLTENPETNVYRLTHGEGDGLPGLIIDYYDGHVVIQCHTKGMLRHVQDIAEALQYVYKGQLKTIYNKSKESLGGASDIDNGFIVGTTASALVRENLHEFYVNWVTGQKTGFFIDQRDNRKLLGSYSNNKSVLNLFCYSGGFSMYALDKGARLVDSVDVSATAMALTNLNAQLMDRQATTHQSHTMEVNKFLQDCQQYDLIVCDPPAFAKSINKRHQALNGYKNLNAKVIQKVKTGGFLFTFSCSQVMDRELFQQTILAAALESRRVVKIVHHLSQSPDHPINLYHPEGSYLKGLVLFVED